MFGVANQDYVDMPEYVVAELVGRVLYGIFTLVIVIVLLNMLIAMITNSFQKIEVRPIGLCVHSCNVHTFLSIILVYASSDDVLQANTNYEWFLLHLVGNTI